MSTNPQKKYGKKYGNRDYLRLVRVEASADERPTTPVAVPIHSPLIFSLDRRMHTAYVQLPGRVVSRGIQEIREQRQHPWRNQARREIEMHADGIPLEEVLRIHDAHRQWIIEDLFGERSGRGWAA